MGGFSLLAFPQILRKLMLKFVQTVFVRRFCISCGRMIISFKNGLYKALGLFFLLLLASDGLAQDRMGSIVGRVRARLLQAEEEGKFSGVVLVGKGDRILLNEGFGWADPFIGIRNTESKRFMIASVSKAFAAASILQLQEKGLLSVQDPISKYLPEYPAWGSENITIHHLLTHTSGIPDYINDFPLKFKLKQFTGWTPARQDLIASFQDRPLNFYPGEDFKYSNSGYVLLARIVEVVSGMYYEKYVAENILEPLGMDDTGMGDFDKVGNRAVAFKGNGNKKKQIENFKSEWIYGMGEIYSTTADLNKWLMSFSDTLILSEASKEAMFTPELHNYAYGWHVYDLYGRQQYSHGGYLPGWNSYVFYFPEDTLSVIVLSNLENANPMEVCGNISRVLYMNGLDQAPKAKEDKYAGRYALEEPARENEVPFAAEIVTVNEEEGSLRVKTPKGQTLRFPKIAQDQWHDLRNEVQIQIRETGGGLVLQVSKNGKQWRWRKLSGDYQLSGLNR
jgi:CubicO group peptidase (beta-lactamase class C family)